MIQPTPHIDYQPTGPLSTAYQQTQFALYQLTYSQPWRDAGRDVAPLATCRLAGYSDYTDALQAWQQARAQAAPTEAVVLLAVTEEGR